MKFQRETTGWYQKGHLQIVHVLLCDESEPAGLELLVFHLYSDSTTLSLHFEIPWQVSQGVLLWSAGFVLFGGNRPDPAALPSLCIRVNGPTKETTKGLDFLGQATQGHEALSGAVNGRNNNI